MSGKESAKGSVQTDLDEDTREKKTADRERLGNTLKSEWYFACDEGTHSMWRILGQHASPCEACAPKSSKGTGKREQLTEHANTEVRTFTLLKGPPAGRPAAPSEVQLEAMLVCARISPRPSTSLCHLNKHCTHETQCTKHRRSPHARDGRQAQSSHPLLQECPGIVLEEAQNEGGEQQVERHKDYRAPELLP